MNTSIRFCTLQPIAVCGSESRITISTELNSFELFAECRTSLFRKTKTNLNKLAFGSVNLSIHLISVFFKCGSNHYNNVKYKYTGNGLRHFITFNHAIISRYRNLSKMPFWFRMGKHTILLCQRSTFVTREWHTQKLK